MSSKTIAGITVTAASEEQSTLDLVAEACAGSLACIREAWGLPAPADCRVYVMTSWREFIFESAPGLWRILVAVTQPLWARRIAATWQYAGGWTQRYGRTVVIGVKPPRLILQSDRSIGARVFVEEQDMTVKVRHIICHELTHACAAHLQLPLWLNEGLAMVAVDRFLQKRTVCEDSRDLVRDFEPKAESIDYRATARVDGKTLAYHTARGYWLVEYLERHRPGFLRGLLAERRKPQALDRDIAAELGMAPETFWRDIDAVIAAGA